MAAKTAGPGRRRGGKEAALEHLAMSLGLGAPPDGAAFAVVLTSPGPGDAVVALAILLAQELAVAHGRLVTVVDASVSKGQQKERFSGDWQDLARPHPGAGRPRLLSVPPGHARGPFDLRSFLTDGANRGQIVIVVAPGVLDDPTPRAWAEVCGRTLMVVRVDEERTAAVKRAAALLKSEQAPAPEIVLLHGS